MDDINAAGLLDERPGGGSFSFEIYDGSVIPRPDGYYDLLLCNSVLEHVPLEQRAALSAEMARVGRQLFVQTPAKGFLIDPHFIMPLVHWVPRDVGRLWPGSAPGVCSRGRPRNRPTNILTEPG